MRIIDMHVHLTPPCVSGRCRELQKTEPYWDLLAQTPRNRYVDAPELIREMDRAGVDQSVVFGFSFRDPGLCREVNTYTMESVAAYPDRLTGFMAVSPGAPGLEAEIDRCQAGGLRGIGELFPEGQGFDITDPGATRTLAGLCRERDLPVMLHVNEPVGHHYPGKGNTTPPEASVFIGNHPELTLILAHWGGGLLFYELMREIHGGCARVYYDTAASVFLYRPDVFRVARELGVLDRVLFGSDFPLIPPDRYFPYLRESGLPEPEIAAILGGNAARLLEGEACR